METPYIRLCSHLYISLFGNAAEGSIVKRRSSVQYIKSLQTLLLLAVISILISARGHRYNKYIRRTVEQKENEHVLLTCRMCAVLAHLLISKVEEGWLMIMENVPQNEKIISLLHYFVEQLTENQDVTIEIGNKHRRGPGVQSGVGIPNKTAS
jgi:hypothetical protein